MILSSREYDNPDFYDPTYFSAQNNSCKCVDNREGATKVVAPEGIAYCWFE